MKPLCRYHVSHTAESTLPPKQLTGVTSSSSTKLVVERRQSCGTRKPGPSLADSRSTLPSFNLVPPCSLGASIDMAGSVLQGPPSEPIRDAGDPSTLCTSLRFTPFSIPGGQSLGAQLILRELAEIRAQNHRETYVAGAEGEELITTEMGHPQKELCTTPPGCPVPSDLTSSID